MSLNPSGSFLRRLLLISGVCCSVLARADATQSGSPPQLDAAAATTEPIQNSSQASFKDAVKTKTAEKQATLSVAEERNDSSQYRRFTDGEGEQK